MDFGTLQHTVYPYCGIVSIVSHYDITKYGYTSHMYIALCLTHPHSTQVSIITMYEKLISGSLVNFKGMVLQQMQWQVLAASLLPCPVITPVTTSFSSNTSWDAPPHQLRCVGFSHKVASMNLPTGNKNTMGLISYCGETGTVHTCTCHGYGYRIKFVDLWVTYTKPYSWSPLPLV